MAVPLFFVGLMAFSLKIDKPSKQVSAHGKVVLGDPTKATVGTIYGVALVVALAVVLVGVLAVLLRSRLAPIVPAVAGIVAAVLLIVPLGSWAAGHTARYPYGTDNIPDGTAAKPNPTNLILKGEWEANAKTTAEEIGAVVIGIGAAAIVLTVLLDVRRRRGRGAYVPPPPPQIAGEPAISAGLELEAADSDLARGNRPGRWRN
jgi:multisubunit Na+/H+ antiporter MnhC subunit